MAASGSFISTSTSTTSSVPLTTIADSKQDDGIEKESKSVTLLEIKMSPEEEDLVYEEYARNAGYFQQGKIAECIAYFKEKLASKKNLSFTFIQFANLIYSALNDFNDSSFLSMLFPPQLKIENIKNLLRLLQETALSSYTDDSENEIEKTLTRINKQLSSFLIVCQYLEKETPMTNATAAEHFLRMLSHIDEAILDLLADSAGFVKKLNKTTRKAIQLTCHGNPEAVREKIASLARFVINDYLFLYEYQGKPYHPFDLLSEAYSHRYGEQFSKQLSTLFPKNKEIGESKHKDSGEKAKETQQSVVYFYDTLDQFSIEAIALRLKEAAKHNIKYFYVELPIELAHFFKRINRTGNMEIIKTMAPQLERNIKKLCNTEQDSEASIAWLRQVMRVIELAYKENLQVFPVASSKPYDFFFSSQSKMQHFIADKNQERYLADNIFIFNKMLSLRQEGAFIGFFNIAFSTIGRALDVPSHGLIHEQSINKELKAAPTKGARFLLSQGLFKLTDPLNEITILQPAKESKEQKELTEKFLREPLIRDYHEASLYIQPLLIEKFLGLPLRPLTKEQAVNICLIANNLTGAEAKKLAEANPGLKELFIAASEKAMNLPAYFKDYLPNPYYTPLGKLLQARTLFSEEKYSAAVNTAKGILFFHAHDDLESYESLIAQLPAMANNKTKPLKHLYLEFQTEFNSLFENLGTSENDKAISDFFAMASSHFTSPRSAGLFLQLIKEAHKNKIKLFAVDSEQIIRSTILLSSQYSSLTKIFLDSADQAMAKEITKHNATLGPRESFIGLFGLLHRNIGNRVADCCNWAYLPRNYLKAEVAPQQVNPKCITEQIADQSSPLAPVLKHFLPTCTEILVTWPCDMEKQHAEIQAHTRPSLEQESSHNSFRK